MTVIVTILFVLNATLLIGVVLIQQPKTAGGLFSGTGQSLLGTSGKTFWTKFTTILAGTFMVLCLLMTFAHRFEKAPSSVTDIIEKQQQQAAPSAQAAGAAPNPSTSSALPQTKPASQENSVPAASSLPGNSKQ